MKSKKNGVLKKCQENVLQFMFLYIIRTPPFRAQIGRLYTEKDGVSIFTLLLLHAVDFQGCFN